MNIQEMTDEDITGQSSIPSEHLLSLVKLAIHNKDEFSREYGEYEEMISCSEIALRNSLK